MQKNKKIDTNNLALVLSGGAARGTYHLGILAYLEDNKIKIHSYSGTSIGSIISCAHASGLKAREILEIFKSDEIKKVLKFNYFKKGLIRIDNKHSIIQKLLPIKKLENLPKKVIINAYDTNTKKVIYFEKGDIATLCTASSALIPIFKPIHYEGHNLIDGGFFDNLPIKPLQNKDYSICTIDVMPRRDKNESKRGFNPLKIFKKKLFKTRFDNALYSIQHTNIYITNYKLREKSMFTFKGLQDNFELGYKDASKYFT